MNTKKVLVPISSYGFDPTEVAIPWKILTENNFEVVFTTPKGSKANADKLMLKGQKLGIWKPILAARKDAVEAYSKMEKTKAFSQPLKYSDVLAKDYDAILLPGGHDKGVREFLESETLQNLIVNFFKAQKNVAAICHGVVLAARSIDLDTGKSVIYDYKTTCLLESQEKLAYNLTRLWLKDYYLTYPKQTVEAEVKSALSDNKNFLKGPSPLLRDSDKHLSRGFFVKDRNYLSARWPGDVYSFSYEFVKMMRNKDA